MHAYRTGNQQISHTDACTGETKGYTVHYAAFCTALVFDYGYCYFDLAFLVGIGDYDGFEWFADALGELWELFVEFYLSFLQGTEWSHGVVDFK